MSTDRNRPSEAIFPWAQDGNGNFYRIDDGAAAPAADSLAKYDAVLLPFLSLMERELRANTGKGDRPGWLSMTREVALLEIWHHVAKLQRATLAGDLDATKEHAADVANMSMMLLDICGGLE